MRNFFYKKLFYYHYQLPDKPTKFFLKKVFKARTLLSPHQTHNEKQCQVVEEQQCGTVVTQKCRAVPDQECVAVPEKVETRNISLDSRIMV